jgi:hypothetical protein
LAGFEDAEFLKDANDREVELTAQSVLEAVQLARSDILEQSTAFVGAFPDGFNLPQITAPMYYKLVLCAKNHFNLVACTV